MVERVGFDLLGVFAISHSLFVLLICMDGHSFLNSLVTKIHFVKVGDTTQQHAEKLPLVCYAVIVKETDRKSLWPTFRNIRYGNGNFISKKYHSDMFTMIVGFPNSVRTEITVLNKFGLILERFLRYAVYSTSIKSKNENETIQRAKQIQSQECTRHRSESLHVQPIKAFTN